MSISPEAKQAAGILNQWSKRTGLPLWDTGSCRYYVERAIEVLGKEHNAATAKLREELELAWGIIANAHGGNWDKESKEWQDAAARWRDRVMPQLAHQQPSATTPEVEKIAREAIRKMLDCSESPNDSLLIVEDALAQAREPLVKDKERLDWLEENASDPQGLTIGGVCYWSVNKGRRRISEGDTLREAIDAALTGTGEQK